VPPTPLIPRRLVRRVLLPLALLVPVAACGDDGNDGADGSADTPGTSAVTLTDAQESLVTRAGEQYADYVEDEVDLLLDGTARFVAAYEAGEDDRARSLYAPTRMHWESIEPVAESFGDLDPKTDAREADLAEGETWTGWHLLEKDLWPAEAGSSYVALTATEREQYAGRLLADLQILDEAVDDLEFTGQDLATGSKELLDEVANGKITGEEEFWSHTDLYDFQANIDGARQAFRLLEPVVDETAPELSATLTERFADLQVLLDRQRVGSGFVDYSTVGEEQRRELSDATNALAEPLSQLAAVVG
jgi:iron uptake system component EfeO